MYGAKVSVRPELTYDDMRQAPENSGNTEENMSLYWHPSVYMHDKTKGTYELADIWFGSSYYVFETGSAERKNSFGSLTSPLSKPKPKSDQGVELSLFSFTYVTSGHREIVYDGGADYDLDDDEDGRNSIYDSGGGDQGRAGMEHAGGGQVRLADIWFGSSYYVFETGSTTAFPNGFNMIAYGSQAKSRSEAICDGPSTCERDDCSTSDASFFPQTACSELEAKIVFPTCWDGVNLVSDDMMSHVSYDIEEGRFDADCPTTHPVKLPEVHFYFRIANYKGGEYTFSSGSSVMHADYFSGWDQTKLQSILDGCSNDSDAASPDQFCEDFLTFRQTKVSGVQTEDDQIRTKLEAIQLHPNPDMKKTVSAEPVDNIASLVRGSCTGTLCPVGGCVGGDDSGDNSGGDADNSGGDTDGESESASDLADGGDGSSVKVGAGALA
eukprot:CAMPEP_0182518736 /NCGR_PEP_ID=MMETSP1321-20130603/44726_1 /TAXON_ID=91990 /ORGANISM="Bolidomonas sp., Strain RCC1657" /LENGTH=438 /DNA_ID=CAMNT_0024726675 /DNA_START=618 /DNA_END=1929 /DNA_ORIENTATION=+